MRALLKSLGRAKLIKIGSALSALLIVLGYAVVKWLQTLSYQTVIVLLYNLLAFVNAVYFLGNLICAVKLYKSHTRWGQVLFYALFTDCLVGLAAVVTLGLGPRPTSIVWWTVILTFAIRIIAAVGIVPATLEFLDFTGIVRKLADFLRKFVRKNNAK